MFKTRVIGQKSPVFVLIWRTICHTVVEHPFASSFTEPSTFHVAKYYTVPVSILTGFEALEDTSDDVSVDVIVDAEHQSEAQNHGDGL